MENIPERRGKPESPQKSRCLFVGNLHYSVSEGDLIKLFRPYGNLEKVHYLWHMTGPHRGKPRGFAFVDFATELDAESALTALDGFEVGGRKIGVRFRVDDVRSTATAQFHSRNKRHRAEEVKTSEHSNRKLAASEDAKVIRTLDDKIARLKKTLEDKK